ncbi:MAG: glycosyltransferase family 39 protein [Chloroflexi bacterium]|nr:glycosyltransferase family 39 protein [Chloroflexota bacterium]
MIIAWLLLLWNLGAPSFSVDEFTNLEMERGSLSAILADLAAGRDLHPPLTHLVVAPWLGIAGDSEWSARFIPVAFGLLSLALLWRLALVWLDRRHAWLAPALLALAPTFHLYVRFEKYYAITMALALLYLVCVHRWSARPTRPRLALLGLATVALLYTDYLAALFFVGTTGLLLILALLKTNRGLLVEWSLAQVASAVFLVPWLATVATQSASLHSQIRPDLAGAPIDFALKLGAVALSFGLGETLFPWRPPGALGLLSSLMLLVAGLLALRRSNSLGLALLTYLLLPIVGGALLFTAWAQTVPFMAFPNHVLFALPVFSVLLAIGAWHLSPKVRFLALALWVGAATTGLLSYHAGQDYLNPIYAVPTREIAATVQDNTARTPGALVLAEYDTGLPFYLARQATPVSVVPPGKVSAMAAPPPEVWLFSFGRDRTRVLEGDARARDWLRDNGYALVAAKSYVPTDPIYGALKRRLLSREVYDAKATLEQWRRGTRE